MNAFAHRWHRGRRRWQARLARPSTLAALAWAAAAFAFYFWYAQYIRTIGWNVIELIIAEHLGDYGTYATSLDYPSALTWRPIVPTLLVAGLRLFTVDPVRIYQLFCGATFATLASCMFLSGRRLGGMLCGHVAAALAITCPALTTYLIHHIHSYSHLGALWVLGPTLLVSVHILRSRRDALSMPMFALAGVLWGLAYLCRTEIFLFAGAFLFALILHRVRPRRHIAACAACFLAFFLAYNLLANYVSERDGLWMRKSIYGFYISQGWVDPGPIDFDTEGEGYLYAVQLYGDPKLNHESLLAAVLHNPEAFLRRVGLNIRSLYGHYADRSFVPLFWSVSALLGLLLLMFRTRALRPIDRVPALFLASVFLMTNFIVIYHIDARYLTINIPALILLSAYAVPLLARFTKRGVYMQLVNAAMIAVFVYSTYPNWKEALQAERERPAGVEPMRAAAKHFRSVVQGGPDSTNREPHIRMRLPKRSSLADEDAMLLAYFSGTAWTISATDGPFDKAWLTGAADGPFPRGRFYSFRDCPEDFVYVPEAAVRRKNPKGTALVAEADLPVLGRYLLFKHTK